MCGCTIGMRLGYRLTASVFCLSIRMLYESVGRPVLLRSWVFELSSGKDAWWVDVAVSNVLVEWLSCCSELPSRVASVLASPSNHRVKIGGYRFCLGGSVARVMVSGSVSFVVCGLQGTWKGLEWTALCGVA